MEIESIEKLLQSLGLESQVKLFQQNKLGIELLMSLPDTKLKKTLSELQIPPVNRSQIFRKIQEMKARESEEHLKDDHSYQNVNEESEERLKDEHSDKETVRERVRKLEDDMRRKSSQFSLIHKPANIQAEKDTEVRVKERPDRLGKNTETPPQVKTEIPDEERMETTSKENTKTKDHQYTVTSDVKSTEMQTNKGKKAETDALPDTASDYLLNDLSIKGTQRHTCLDPVSRGQVQTKKQYPELFQFSGHVEDVCTLPVLSDSLDHDSEELSPYVKRQEEIRIVLLGKTGTGKSATGNTILGEKLFQSSASGSSITSRCSQRSSIRFGRKVVIVDTPGIFDTAHSNEHTQNEICKCIGITSPGPHAFIIVISVSRFTEEEQKAVEHFIKHFGENIYKYAMILFTRKDDLDEENKSLFDHLQTAPPHLRLLSQKCGGRVFAFNNRLKGEEQDAQAKELLYKILKNVEENGGKCYTNEMYEEAEKILRNREEEIKRKAKEEHEKELKDIEEAIARKYEKKHAEDARKLKSMERQLYDLLFMHEQAKKQVQDLKNEVEMNKKQLKEKKGKEREDLQSNLERLQRALEETKSNEKNKALEIKKLKKSREAAEKQQREMIKRQQEESNKQKREMHEKFERRIDTVRDEVRKEVEQGGGFFSKAFSWIKRKLKFW